MENTLANVPKQEKIVLSNLEIIFLHIFYFVANPNGEESNKKLYFDPNSKEKGFLCYNQLQSSYVPKKYSNGRSTKFKNAHDTQKLKHEYFVANPNSTEFKDHFESVKDILGTTNNKHSFISTSLLEDEKSCAQMGLKGPLRFTCSYHPILNQKSLDAKKREKNASKEANKSTKRKRDEN
jgi:hypothetical protein